MERRVPCPRVAIVITGLEVGGAESFLAELLRFRPPGVEFRVFTLIDGGAIAERLQAAGVSVTGLHMEAGRPSISALVRLATLLRAYRPGIVHTWMYHADLLGGIAARLAGVRRVIWHLHNSDLSPERVRLMTRLVVRLNSLLAPLIADVVLSCSKTAAAAHVDLGYPAKRMQVVPNGVDTARFAPLADAASSIREEFDVPPGVPVIGLVARLDPQKNHRGFFDAAQRFFEDGGDAFFVLVGRGVTSGHWQLEEWRQLTGRPERIALVGQRSDVSRLMAGFDITTSSSLGEAFPMTLIEAMSCGTPCAATDVGDNALIIGDAGIIVPPGDPVALAAAWRMLTAMPELERVALGCRSRERVIANFSIEDVARRIWAQYGLPQRCARREGAESDAMRVAYLSLQAVRQGQDSWAAVNEIVSAWEDAGWQVERWFPDYPVSGAPGPLGRAREMWRLQRALRRRLATYDALYVRGHSMGYPASLWARRAGLSVFQECNGTYEDLFIAWPLARLGRPLFEHMQRTQYRLADTIFCGTENQRDWLRHETGHDRIVVSPNGANIEVFTPDAPRRDGLPARFAVFFGQFAPWQGIDVLVEAKRDPAWPQGIDLVFVGSGDRARSVKAAAASDSGVHYVGRLPYEELSGVISHSLVAFSTQYTPERGEEGFSALKLYESMACGVPVIGSDYPGVGDVIRHYESGIVVPPGDAAAIASAVAKLASEPAEAKRMGRNGRIAVEHDASWKARARGRQEIMERTIQASRSSDW